MNRLLVLFSFIFLLLSCKDEELTAPMINDELQPYIDRFYSEAESRGISLAENMDAFINSDTVACGQGHSPEFNGMFSKPTIIINEDCWGNLNDVAREILVFHELGHALLNRLHIDGNLPNGHKKSIMCAGVDFDCSGMPDYLNCPAYRDYYVDELFNDATNAPEWATRNWDVLATISSDLDANFSTDWQVFTNCPTNGFEISIDSLNPNRPSTYSLRLNSSCAEATTVRRRIGIDNPSAAEAIRMKCDLYHTLTGDEFSISLFVKNTDNSFTSYNRTTASEIINAGNSLTDFSLQAECLTPEADSLIFSFHFLPNTEGEVFIGNLEIQLME